MLQDTLSGQKTHDYSVQDLINIALKDEGAVLSKSGALVVTTGQRTGRSPADRFIVDDHLTSSTVAWGKVNKKIDKNTFTKLWQKTSSYLENNSFSAKLQVGADLSFGLNVDVITEKAWHNIFLRHLFISDNLLNIPADRTWTLLSAPDLKLNPNIDNCFLIISDLLGAFVIK